MLSFKHGGARCRRPLGMRGSRRLPCTCSSARASVKPLQPHRPGQSRPTQWQAAPAPSSPAPTAGTFRTTSPCVRSSCGTRLAVSREQPRFTHEMFGARNAESGKVRVPRSRFTGRPGSSCFFLHRFRSTIPWNIRPRVGVWETCYSDDRLSTFQRTSHRRLQREPAKKRVPSAPHSKPTTCLGDRQEHADGAPGKIEARRPTQTGVRGTCVASLAFQMHEQRAFRPHRVIEPSTARRPASN